MITTIIAWLVLGAIAGYIAGFLVPGDEGLGVVGKIVLGIVGAVVGGFLIGLLPGVGNPIGGRDVLNIPSVIAAVIGAVIVVLAVGFFRGNRRAGAL